MGGEEKDALERRGFRDGMDFRLGAIEQLTERKRERERKTHRKVPTQININKIEKKSGTNVRICDMQK